MPEPRLRVLVIDDDEDDFIILKDILGEIEHTHFELDWTPRSADGLKALEEARHDVYLVDYSLGESTGLDLVRTARASGVTAPVILLTGRGDAAVDREALESGASDFLVKGAITPCLLERSIRYSLHRSRSEAELRRTVERLERSNRDLTAYAHVASHELKEPLSMVVSYLQLLEKRHLGNLNPEAREFMGFAVGAATRMQALIHDLLEFARVSNAPIEVTPVNAGRALETAMAELAQVNATARGKVTWEQLPIVWAAEAGLVQVFRNLVGNALKFRGDKSPEVHVGAKLHDGYCELSVKDNGIGIDTRYSGKLFQLFQRLHSRGAYPGTGIGLAVSKRIVERLGGSIWFNSEPNKGTTFYFTLPTSREAAFRARNLETAGPDEGPA